MGEINTLLAKCTVTLFRKRPLHDWYFFVNTNGVVSSTHDEQLNFTTPLPPTDETKKTAFCNYLPMSALVLLFPGGRPSLANHIIERPE